MFKKLKRLAYLKFARKLNNAPTVPVPSIISENTKLTGDIISNGIVHVDGRVEGDVTCEELVIGLKGQQSASLRSVAGQGERRQAVCCQNRQAFGRRDSQSDCH